MRTLSLHLHDEAARKMEICGTTRSQCQGQPVEVGDEAKTPEEAQYIRNRTVNPESRVVCRMAIPDYGCRRNETEETGTR